MRRLLVAGCALLLLLSGACGGGGDGGGDGDGAAPGPAAGSADADLSYYDTPPPWPLASRQADRILAAGLPQLKAEGDLVHYHAQLDVFYDGRKVVVPANIGVDAEEAVISPLHTHDPSGLVHIEAEEDADFTIGQLLIEWGVRVRDGCIADKCADEVAVFVDGSIQDVFAGDLVIKADKRIRLVLGTEAPAGG